MNEDIWRASRKKMEEKARLYAAMKRGDVEDTDGRYAVDFDRKWAEAEVDGENDRESSDGEDDQGSDEEMVEYEDEFGRTRTGTRAQAAREETRKRHAGVAATQPQGRPDMPNNVIYGATIQSQAFNPDEGISSRMAELAAKRDKEVTPPPEEHFDGRKEIRTKGVGYFQFSTDQEERKRQMAELEKERQETEAKRKEVDNRKEARRKEVEARKKAISEKRSKARTERFLDSLREEVQAKADMRAVSDGRSREHEPSSQ